MKKRNRLLRISAVLLVGFYSLLIFHPNTASFVLCCQPDGSTQMELASMDFTCICSHSHDRDHWNHDCRHHNHMQQDQDDKVNFSEVYVFCRDIPITNSGFATDIPHPAEGTKSPAVSHISIPAENSLKTPFSAIPGIRKPPQTTIYKSLFTILC